MPDHQEWYSRGYLPHRDAPELIQHLTLHLADSLSADAIERIEHSILTLDHELRLVERRRRIHAWVEAGHGSCILVDAAIASGVQSVLQHFNRDRYQLHAWVIMPNHLHVLFHPMNGWTMQQVVATWKKRTGRIVHDSLRDQQRAAMVEALSPLWHREPWDRYIRDREHYQAVVTYIHQNPVRARLVKCASDWPWSSASLATT